MTQVRFFGCMGEPGHYLWRPGGSIDWDNPVVTLPNGRHIDGELPPRLPNGGEAPQGMYRRHLLSNGWSALAWWDRAQGDRRGGCNSVVLMEGDRPPEELLAALREHWPSVLDRLKAAGVELRPWEEGR